MMVFVYVALASLFAGAKGQQTACPVACNCEDTCGFLESNYDECICEFPVRSAAAAGEFLRGLMYHMHMCNGNEIGTEGGA